MATKEEIRQLVHTPAELGAEFVAWAEHIRANPGIQFGVPAIDRVVIPMRPGDLVSLIGRPGHGKSSLMAYFARQEATRIVERGKEREEAVVYTTFESSAEELENFFQTDGEVSASDVAWGRVDLEFIRAKSVKRASLPIWTIGHGIARAGTKMARMTPEVILGAIESMREEFGVKPTLLLFDYLQLIPILGMSDRVQRITEVPIKVKELALRIGCPAIVGVQARREVDDRKEKIPDMRDAQWASSIEQTCDKTFGLWRPIRTETANSMIEIEGSDKSYQVNDRLLILRLLKQRGDRGRHTWGMYFAPEYLKLAEMETKTAAETPGSWWD
jgi:replicative DNA helicase